MNVMIPWATRCTAALLLGAALLLADDKLAEAQKKIQDPDPVKRVSAVRDLAAMGGEEAMKTLAFGLADVNARVRAFAVKYLKEVGDEGNRRWLIKVGAHHKEAQVRAGVAEAAAAWGEEYYDHLIEAAKDQDPRVREAALRGMTGATGTKLDAALEQGLKDTTPPVRIAALEVLASRRDATEVLRGLLAKDADPRVRVAALDTLARVLKEKSLNDQVAALKDQHWSVGASAAINLRAHPAKEAIGPLIEALAAADGRLRGDYARALADITGNDLGLDVDAWREWWGYHEQDWQKPEKPSANAFKTQEGGFFGIPLWSKRLSFVLDLSGGMSRVMPEGGGATKVDTARKELMQALAHLPEGAKFNVIYFGTKVTPLAKQLIPGKKQVLQEAFEFIKKQQPAGRTNFYDALELAFQDDEVDTLYVLSEGAPNEGVYFNKTEILERVALLNRYRKLVLHCVEIGEQADKKWTGFFKDLVDQTGGVHVHIGVKEK